jgi:lactoylglutathione lyase
VKTLHTAYRVTDLAVSLDFYSALGYREVGRVSMGEGASLTMLKFPGEQVVTLELVHRPADGPVQAGTGFSHLVVQVDELAATIEALSQGACSPARSSIRPARPARAHRGSPTPTATGSSWCSGRPAIPTGSAPPTSPKPAPQVTRLRGDAL